MNELVSLAHGSGGEASKRLVAEIVEKYFRNDVISQLDDSAVLKIGGGRIALTTDSYVVDPIFFPGGDIGSLAVNGTVNDLSMVGAQPAGLTFGLIIEEGFALSDLRKVLASAAAAAREAGVEIVGGDTKVVERGAADGIFVNTSGVGVVPEGVNLSSANARPGDVVILSGTIGDHGIAILSKREGIAFETGVVSDSAPLNRLVASMLEASGSIHTMRDPTRGGLATTLNEIAQKSGVGIVLDESRIPVRPEVGEACDLLGLDVYYVANEGKLAAFLPEREAGAVLAAMRASRYGEDSVVVGRVIAENPGMVSLETAVGGRRVLTPLWGELLPRIC